MSRIRSRRRSRTINPALSAEAGLKIHGMLELNPLTQDHSTPFGALALPQTADATLEDDSIVNLALNWSPIGYDDSQPGIVTLNATPVLIDGVANPDGVVAEID